MIDIDDDDSFADRLIGSVIQGRYRVDRAIGKGGMGVVYEAEHLLIGRKVALKTLSAHASFSQAHVERFLREARAAASVGSSHVVDVLDMGSLDGGSFFMVLEHLDGVDLGYAVASERFSPQRAVKVLSQLCDALTAVHEAGIVHRDLKPENIFLIARDGQRDFVKVLDFGVCKFVGQSVQRLTGTGDTVGTPLFMAPEQVEGRSDIDFRVDIYALGAILFFTLTGRTPFAASNLPKLFTSICTQPPPSVRSIVADLPAELDAVLERALAKRPEQRFASCAEFKAALQQTSLVGAPHSTQRSYVLGETGADTQSLKRALKLEPANGAVIAALGFVGVLTIVAALIHFGGPASRPHTAATVQHVDRSSPVAAALPVPPLPPLDQPADVVPKPVPSASSSRTTKPRGVDSRVPEKPASAPTPSARTSSAPAPEPTAPTPRVLGEPNAAPPPAPTASSPGADHTSSPRDDHMSSPAGGSLMLNREPKRGL